MREIKFRAWDTHNEKWTLPLVATSGRTTLVEPFNHRKDTRGNLIKIKLMQYTGLKDKNGKEIYEDDIVEHDFLGEREKSVVRFMSGTWEMKLLSSLEVIFSLYGLDYSIKIIGNIYENPELLVRK